MAARSVLFPSVLLQAAGGPAVDSLPSSQGLPLIRVPMILDQTIEKLVCLAGVVEPVLCACTAEQLLQLVASEFPAELQAACLTCIRSTGNSPRGCAAGCSRAGTGRSGAGAAWRRGRRPGRPSISAAASASAALPPRPPSLASPSLPSSSNRRHLSATPPSLGRAASRAVPASTVMCEPSAVLQSP